MYQLIDAVKAYSKLGSEYGLHALVCLITKKGVNCSLGQNNFDQKRGARIRGTYNITRVAGPLSLPDPKASIPGTL